MHKFIQLTDCHLCKSNNDTMHGIRTNQRFLFIINKLKLITDKYDFILATGDISQDMSLESYTLFNKGILELNKPTYYIPGNHDKSELMHKHLMGQRIKPLSKLNIGDYILIAVDTVLKGSNEGLISKKELTALQKKLFAFRDKKIILVMHHQPSPVGTPVVDNFMLKNHIEFWHIVKKHGCVKHIIFGHVHGNYSFKYNNVLLSSSISTCIQFRKKISKLEFDKQIGFKLYDASKKILTQKEFSFNYD